MITQEKLKELVEYKEDGNLVWKVSRKNCPVGRVLGRNSFDYNGYRKTMLLGKNYLVSRLIFLYHHGYLPKEVDHKNRDRKDNRIENLRAATRQQNSANTNRSSSSGYIGVYFERSMDCWNARITVNKKLIYLGFFNTAIEAAKVYDKAADKYFGEFATLNFPGGSNDQENQTNRT